MKLFLRRKVEKVNFFFCFLTNTAFLRRENVWERFELNSAVLVAGSATPTKLESTVFKFLRSSAGFWSLFWKFVSLDRDSSFGFFAELELIGLGFRIKKITSSLYRFFWGHSNYVYLFVPATVLIEYAHDERLIFFFSTNVAAVNNIVSYLLLLKKLSAYRITGFVQPGKIIRLNSGKQR